MTDKWVVDQQTGEGHAVPMTAAEQAQFDADQQAAQQVAQAQAVLDGNAATMSDRAAAAIGNLETAATNWATLTAAQKDQALRLSVQVVIRLTRLMLRRLDAAP